LTKGKEKEEIVKRGYQKRKRKRRKKEKKTGGATFERGGEKMGGKEKEKKTSCVDHLSRSPLIDRRREKGESRQMLSKRKGRKGNENKLTGHVLILPPGKKEGRGEKE